MAAVTASAVLMLIGASRADDRAVGREEAVVDDLATLVPDETLDPRIIAMDLEGAVWEDRLGDLDAALFLRADADRRLSTTTAALIEARRDLRATEQALAAADAEAIGLDGEIEEHRAVLQARALALFIGHGEEDRLDELDSIEEATAGARHRQLAAEVDEAQLDVLATLEARREDVADDIVELEGRAVALETNVASLELAFSTASADRARAEEAIPAAVESVRRARRSADIPDLDLSVVALDAYLRAEISLADSDPGCGIEWWMIAGVGRVESRHGQIGGRTITAGGRPSSPIIGIALDGRPGIRAITDSDGGRLDGDTEWDRAVGPMQFIPETWSIRGRDGDGDGVQDPQNLYDAALAAGRYLCRLGGNLGDSANLADAYFGYNTSSAYVDLVTRHALRYAAVDLPELPEVPVVEPDDA